MSELQNKVQLITYPDSVGDNLKDLRTALESHFEGLFGGVHVLPFYPSSADRGFAPLTHMEVDPAFGDWDDIQAIAEKYDLVVDLIVNHISRQSVYFKDFLEYGDSSKWHDLFLDVDEFLARYNETSIDSLRETYRPRPTLPITEFTLADGTKKRLWCTFTTDQIDLDLTRETARALVQSFVENLISRGASCIRLDAIGYAIKKPDTSSFLLPETYDLIGWIKNIVKSHQTELLAEVHRDYRTQQELAAFSGVDWVYDFALPLLTLHALHSGSADNLRHWIEIRPQNQITTLDTHDGIGVVDVEGLMKEDEINETVAKIHAHGGNDSVRASGIGADNVDIYQINSTYYSALGEEDDAYIAARAIQFFVPGIPQVYYVGLLAGSNDIELFARTNHGRDVNRHSYSLSEIEGELKRPVVERLFRLIRFRNTHPAFNGEFTLEESGAYELKMRWEKGEAYCRATIDVSAHTVSIEYSERGEKDPVVEVF